MQHEYYFSETVNENTWEDFLLHISKRDLSEFYKEITGYGWKDIFGFNPNGSALYIDEKENRYGGVWFDVGSKRIAVYKSE